MLAFQVLPFPFPFKFSYRVPSKYIAHSTVRTYASDSVQMLRFFSLPLCLCAIVINLGFDKYELALFQDAFPLNIKGIILASEYRLNCFL